MDKSSRAAFYEKLSTLVQGPVQTGASVCDIHGRDESWIAPARPDAVFTPTCAEDAAIAVALCAEARIPVIPFGVGSGQEGGVIAIHGGLSIDTSALNRVLEINTDDMECLVEAGVTRLSLDQELRATGLFFPVDPGADASLGGMVATGAAGTTTPLYGAMAANVLGLEVVTADGQIIPTGSRALKSSAGYNLTQLFVASEGTLGLVTKVRLRLHPRPEASVGLKAHFADLGQAVRAVSMMRASGLRLARAELMNATLMRGIGKLFKQDFNDSHLLCLEFHSDAHSASHLAIHAAELAGEFGGESIETVTRAEDLAKIWRARHSAAEAEKLLRPGAGVIVTDVCVPVSKLADFIDAAENKLSKLSLIAPLSGHIADGNYHYALLVDVDQPDEVDRASTFKTWLADAALAIGGTISGEHGIGLGKRHLMQQAHGPALTTMRAIKAALDPQNIFNPGKVLPNDD